MQLMCKFNNIVDFDLKRFPNNDKENYASTVITIFMITCLVNFVIVYVTIVVTVVIIVTTIVVTIFYTAIENNNNYFY